MVSTLGRVLTVFIAMTSVAFMAFALTRWQTVPDWASEAKELEDFVLTRTEGANPQWVASTRRTQEQVESSPNAGKVLAAMYTRAAQDAQAELDAYNQEIPELETQIADAKAAIVEDEAGVAARTEQLLARVTEMDEEVERLTAESEREKATAQDLQNQRKRRRSDVLRIREQLGELEADRFRAEQLEKHLTDIIRRIQGNVAKLQSRNQQFEQPAQ